MTDSKTELFHRELGIIINCFDRIINSINFNTKELAVFYVLIKKIISNATAANILIYKNYINEAKIILRSAIETTVLIAYLSKFPDKKEEYIIDSQILRVKNSFISYKATGEGEINEITGHKHTKEELHSQLKHCFNKTIAQNAQDKILKDIGIEEFIVTKENFKKIDNYFSKFKPKFMSCEKMYKELDDANFKIIGKYEFSLRELMYSFYNDNSQIAHGCLLNWLEKSNLNKQEAEYLFHLFIKITLFLKILLKGMVDFENDKTKPIVQEMLKAHQNIEKLIYGRVLEH